MEQATVTTADSIYNRNKNIKLYIGMAVPIIRQTKTVYMQGMMAYKQVMHYNCCMVLSSVLLHSPRFFDFWHCLFHWFFIVCTYMNVHV